MSTISLSLAKPGPGEGMPGPYSSSMVLRRRASRKRCRTGGPWEEIGGQRRRRSDSTFDFKQRQWHAPQRGACDCEERIRQLVVFTPGSCPRQHAQTLGRDSMFTPPEPMRSALSYNSLRTLVVLCRVCYC